MNGPAHRWSYRQVTAISINIITQEEPSHTYGNIGQGHNPPVPPRRDRERHTEPTSHPVPPIPPRTRNTDQGRSHQVMAVVILHVLMFVSIIFIVLSTVAICQKTRKKSILFKDI